MIVWVARILICDINECFCGVFLYINCFFIAVVNVIRCININNLYKFMKLCFFFQVMDSSKT